MIKLFFKVFLILITMSVIATCLQLIAQTNVAKSTASEMMRRQRAGRTEANKTFQIKSVPTFSGELKSTQGEIKSSVVPIDVKSGKSPAANREKERGFSLGSLLFGASKNIFLIALVTLAIELTRKIFGRFKPHVA
jgi:hypothetical protein